MTVLKVLVVEDEMLIAMDMEDMLVEMGFKVIGPAPCLEKGTELACRETIDLAVLDINLAGRDSFPIADILRERGIPFIFASGYGAAGLSDDYADTTTLQKPVEFLQLRAAMSSLQ
ncbi:response regulator (plasmid) [Paracoccus liaowanqingii]|uniref:Response regulator n=1 Tax=Paracoccus liaowanqingii TaxID=2560053 RepID=A0A4Y5STQ9_9RHOB|nr:response regulator [Paracoccus liaowanqingii]QDA36165.1 response regulator [Paracoccus liaowanqingii]